MTRTVPAGVAATLLAGRPTDLALASACGRLVGRRAEVDCDALAARGHLRLARALWRYHQQCRQLWAGLLGSADGTPAVATLGHVLVRRPVREMAQSTARGAKSDLNAEYDALRVLPGVADLLEAVTEPVLDEERVRRAQQALGAEIDRAGESVTVTVALPGTVTLPDVLGGVPHPGEVRRVLSFTVRHAPWRDRRVRRLAAVRVFTDEVWACPADARGELDASAAPSAA